MRKHWWTGILVVAGCLMAAGSARAADHRDGAAVKTDAATDITDVYAWMSPDGAKVWLVMNVFPIAGATSKFSDSALYAFHIRSGASYGDANAKPAMVVCKFAVDQKISCWAGVPGAATEYVTGDASATAGISSTSGNLKVFAGLRDDPFFFNIRGFLGTVGLVKQVAGGLVFNAAGCPTLDAPTAQVAANSLKSDGAGGAGTDDFRKGGAISTTGNVLSIAIAVDKSVVTPGGAILGVWGSTNKPANP